MAKRGVDEVLSETLHEHSRQFLLAVVVGMVNREQNNCWRVLVDVNSLYEGVIILFQVHYFENWIDRWGRILCSNISDLPFVSRNIAW